MKTKSWAFLIFLYVISLLLIGCAQRPTTDWPRLKKEAHAINSIGMTFVRIPKGTFFMGNAAANAHISEKPSHCVTLTKSFEIQTTEVTQSQWQAVMGSNPSRHNNDINNPVEMVSWIECQEFIRRLNLLDPGKNYRLPTEAQWEYACRAGTDDARVGNPDSIAWYSHNCITGKGIRTHPVGLKRPNNWGLYDMFGNVWEYCTDWYGDYSAAPEIDPTGPLIGTERVLRGESWNAFNFDVTVSIRASANPWSKRSFNSGFRVVRDLTR